MSELLSKFLKKLGVKEFSELTSEEKETYRVWEEALSGRKLTDEEVTSFLEREENGTIEKLIGSERSSRDDIFLKMKLELIRKIRFLLSSPEIERKMVEQNIKSQLNET